MWNLCETRVILLLARNSVALFHSDFSFEIRFKIVSAPAYNLVYFEILWRKTVSVKKIGH